jgi:hypothetical protein
MATVQLRRAGFTVASTLATLASGGLIIALAILAALKVAAYGA